MNNIKLEIAKSITYLMSEQELDVKNLSLLSELPEDTIVNVLNGKIEPTINILQKICSVFNINTCKFFDDIICEYYIDKCIEKKQSVS